MGWKQTGAVRVGGGRGHSFALSNENKASLQRLFNIRFEESSSEKYMQKKGLLPVPDFSGFFTDRKSEKVVRLLGATSTTSALSEQSEVQLAQLDSYKRMSAIPGSGLPQVIDAVLVSRLTRNGREDNLVVWYKPHRILFSELMIVLAQPSLIDESILVHCFDRYLGTTNARLILDSMLNSGNALGVRPVGVSAHRQQYTNYTTARMEFATANNLTMQEVTDTHYVYIDTTRTRTFYIPREAEGLRSDFGGPWNIYQRILDMRVFAKRFSGHSVEVQWHMYNTFYNERWDALFLVVHA